MEMQQIRYFVALADTLNFTRAAEQCNVSQPALTRAIQQLEHELGGPLLRREGRHSHLTELGQKTLPLLRKCYDSALSAKTLATTVKTGERSSFSLGIAQTLDVALLLAPLAELSRHFRGMRLRLRRGNVGQIAEMLKSGDIELAISGPLAANWDRLDSFPMFIEAFDYIAVANGNEDKPVCIEDLKTSPFLLHRGALTDDDEATLSRAGIDPVTAHQVESCHDLEVLIRANLGVGIAPRSALQSEGLRHLRCAELDLTREIAIYAVAGRLRSREANAFLNLVRSADWSALGTA